MKKLFAMLLAAMMIFASVSALAEEAVTVEADSPSAVVELGPVGMEFLQMMEEAVEQGMPAISVFSPETQEAVKQVVGEDTTVDEMFGLNPQYFDVEKGIENLVFMFLAADYEVGDPVSAVLVLVNGDEEPVEIVLEAEVVEDNLVKIWFPVEVQEQLFNADEAFIAIVSAAK